MVNYGAIALSQPIRKKNSAMILLSIASVALFMMLAVIVHMSPSNDDPVELWSLSKTEAEAAMDHLKLAGMGDVPPIPQHIKDLAAAAGSLKVDTFVFDTLPAVDPKILAEVEQAKKEALIA